MIVHDVSAVPSSSSSVATTKPVVEAMSKPAGSISALRSTALQRRDVADDGTVNVRPQNRSTACDAASRWASSVASSVASPSDANDRSSPIDAYATAQLFAPTRPIHVVPLHHTIAVSAWVGVQIVVDPFDALIVSTSAASAELWM